MSACGWSIFTMPPPSPGRTTSSCIVIRKSNEGWLAVGIGEVLGVPQGAEQILQVEDSADDDDDGEGEGRDGVDHGEPEDEFGPEADLIGEVNHGVTSVKSSVWGAGDGSRAGSRFISRATRPRSQNLRSSRVASDTTSSITM